MARCTRRSLSRTGVIAAMVVAISAGASEPTAQSMASANPGRPIEEVLKAHTDTLMRLPGVVGTAQGRCDGRPCIKVYVIRKTPELSRSIPNELDGHPVSVEETGEFKALSKDK